MDSSFTRTLLWLGAIASAVALLLYLFVFDMWQMPDGNPLLVASVEPNLKPGDRVLLRRKSPPGFGDLARCELPGHANTYAIGRLFGLGGDTVEVLNERVAVRGRSPLARSGCGQVAVVHPLSRREIALGCSVEDSGKSTYSVLTHPGRRERQTTMVVAPGKAFLVSDNRHIHYDSRDFGPVEASTCEHVVFRLWGETFADGARRFNIL